MPKYYAQVDEEMRVFTVSELAGEVDSPNMIPITEEQYLDGRLLLTRYVDGQFQGYFARMESDKSSIRPDGEDVVTVKVLITDWKGEILGDFNKEVTLELNGMQQSVKAMNGIAEITISSEEPGDFKLKTAGLDRNAELKVVVVDGD